MTQYKKDEESKIKHDERDRERERDRDRDKDRDRERDRDRSSRTLDKERERRRVVVRKIILFLSPSLSLLNTIVERESFVDDFILE